MHLAERKCKKKMLDKTESNFHHSYSFFLLVEKNAHESINFFDVL